MPLESIANSNKDTAPIDTTSRPENKSTQTEETNQQLTNQQLTNQDGNSIIIEKHAQGKISLVNFIYTHCKHVCPTQTASLSAIQKQLPKAIKSNIIFYSITTDPERDTPIRLQQYAASFNTDLDYWHFLTGQPNSVNKLVHQFNARNTQANASPQDHRDTVYMLGPNFNVIQVYNGSPLNRQRLVKELVAAEQIFLARQDRLSVTK